MTKILLVEDNLISQKMMFYTFRAAGARSDVASDGFEAVSMAATGAYDVILMDITMPGIDGYQATARIREAEAMGQKRAYIIGLTGNVYDSERQKCLAAGMDDFMPKPFDIESFKLILERNGMTLV